MSNKVKIAINGFGRIGRNVARAYFERYDEYQDTIDLVAVNNSKNYDTLAHLFKYDSVHRTFKGSVKIDGDKLVVNGKSIQLLAVRNLEDQDWKSLGVDIVIESTGAFLTRADAQKHIDGGARKVIITAPSKDTVDANIVIGVNDADISADKHIYSNVSCTTNCLAPMVKVLEENFGIDSGFLLTIHAYTRDQNIVDAPHKDLRRARSAAVSIIPTTTGATNAIEKIYPSLKGKLTGYATRVPVPDGSLTDFTCKLKKITTLEEINAAFKKAAEGPLKGIMEYQTDPIVSSDIIGNTHSVIFDSLLTQVIPADGTHIRVVGWYDNEWGYSNRVLDLAKQISKTL
ncbi:glyceraldehyde-3-phosphate dehydrogenase 2-like [Periplaneta americana]|uniref:glyceraldehyde-3-phosphate dehydrogenase 2-like n=1 Tax=Periplaneta americana TaxID=6978 RepID=UPI0037E98CCA